VGSIRALAALLLVTGCSGGTIVEDGSHADLFGRWRNVELKVYLEDGSVRSQSASVECITEVSRNRSVTDCTLPNRNRTRVVSKVIAWTAHGYELECVEHSVFPQAVGLRTRVEYRIEGNKRYSTLYPPRVQTPGARSSAVKMETVDIRD
jgi:hypothetical protein